MVVRTNSNFLEKAPIRFVKSKHHIGITITITTTIKCQGDKVEKEKNIWTGSDDQNKTTEESKMRCVCVGGLMCGIMFMTNRGNG